MIELAPRYPEMVKVHTQMTKLAMMHRNNLALVRVLPYVALVLAGCKKVENMPVSVRKMVGEICNT